MRRSIAVLTLVVSLLGLSIPASAHTTHGHTCNTTHSGWFYDSSTWRHNSQIVYHSSGDYYRTVQGHWEWLAGDGLNKWVWRHNTATTYCAI